MPLFVQQQESKLELSVAGTFVYAALLEGLEGVFDQTVCSRVLDAEAVPLRGIFAVYRFQGVPRRGYKPPLLPQAM